MNRLLSAAAALLSAVGFAVPAFAQYTTVTGTQLKMGGVLIPAGTVTMTPINNIGYPISVVTTDDTLNAPQGFSAAITNGAIAAGFAVPDQVTAVATTANTPISYQVMVYNSSSKTSFSLTIPGTTPVVTGTTFALDHYTPSQTATVSPAGLIASNTIGAHCTAPLKQYTLTTPVVNYDCVGGVLVQETGSSGGTSVVLKTNGGTNSTQSLLNLVAGANVTLANDGSGNTTIAASATGGSATTDASQLTAGILPNARLAGVPNSALANAAITINGTAVPLGGSTTIAGGSSLPSGSGLVKVTGGVGALATGDADYTTPAALASEVTRATAAEASAANASNLSSGTVPNARLSAIPNSALANPSVTINGTAVPLGSSYTVSNIPILSGGATATTGLVGLYIPNLDAAGGTTLVDHSGHGNNCTFGTGSGAPTLSSVNGVVTLLWGSTIGTQATAGVECPGITGPVTVQFVYKLTQPNADTSHYRTFAGYSVNPGMALYEATSVVATPAPVRNVFFVQPTTGAYVSLVPTGNGYNFVSLSLGSTDGLYLNGQLGNFAGNPQPGSTPPSGGNFEIGITHNAIVNANGVMHDGAIYAVAVYSTALPSQQVTANLNAFQGYFGPLGINLTNTTSSLASVPYNVACDTTSIDAGTGGGTPPCNLMALGSNYTIQIPGVPSATLAQHLSVNLALEQTMVIPTAQNILAFGGPVTNDIYYGATVSQTEALTSQAVARAKTIGYQQVMVGTLISRNTTLDTSFVSYNTWLRQNVSSLGITLLDIAAVPGFAPNGTNSGNPTNGCNGSACYVGDATHPTLAGETVYGAVEKAVIQSVTGYSVSSPNSQAAAYTMTASDRALLAPITAATTDTLPDCTGLTGADYRVTNTSSSFTLTMAGTTAALYGTITAQSIVGSATVAAQTPATFTSQLTSATAGGCYWLRTQ